MDKGRILIFSAPSGAGKTTIVKHLTSLFPQLAFSVSVTTRPSRPGEVHGKDYYFLSKEEFRQKIQEGEFAEHEEVYDGLYYGTLKSEVERIRNSGRHVVLDVDVEGGKNLKQLYGKEALGIFVRPPSIAALKERLESRQTESEETIEMRINKASSELEEEQFFDMVLVNNDLHEAFAESEKIVTNYLRLPIPS